MKVLEARALVGRDAARTLQTRIKDPGVRGFLDTAIRDFGDVSAPASMVRDPDPSPTVLGLALDVARFHLESGERKVSFIEGYTQKAGFDIIMIG